MPQTPADLLYLETVAEECGAGDGGSGRCRALLDRLAPGVPDDTHPRDLSEGQRLALALALVLVDRPGLLLLDEPTRGLDYPGKEALAAILRELAAEGMAVLVATHDVEFVAQAADDLLVMAEGELVSRGPVRGRRPVAGLRAAGDQGAGAAVADGGRRAGGPGEQQGQRRPSLTAFRAGARRGVRDRADDAVLAAALQAQAGERIAAAVPLPRAAAADRRWCSRRSAKAASTRGCSRSWGVLSAVNAVLRALSPGLAGVELTFFLLILAGRVYGPGFGFVLGCTSLFASALLTAGVGPWLPFQMLDFPPGWGCAPGCCRSGSPDGARSRCWRRTAWSRRTPSDSS